MDGFIKVVTDEDGRVIKCDANMITTSSKEFVESEFETIPMYFKDQKDCLMVVGVEIHTMQVGGVCEPVEYDNDIVYKDKIIIKEGYKEYLRGLVKDGAIPCEEWEGLYDEEMEWQ